MKLETNIDINTVEHRFMRYDEKTEKLKAFDLSYFVSKSIFW